MVSRSGDRDTTGTTPFAALRSVPPRGTFPGYRHIETGDAGWSGWQIVRDTQEMHAIGKNGCISLPVLSIIG